MKKSSSWEFNTSSAIQDFSLLQWNPKFHYRVHNSPPLVAILSQTNPNYDLRSLTPILILSSHHWSVSSSEFLIVPDSINLSVRNHAVYTLLDRRIEFNWTLNKYGTVQPAYSGTARDLFFPLHAGAFWYMYLKFKYRNSLLWKLSDKDRIPFYPDSVLRQVSLHNNVDCVHSSLDRLQRQILPATGVNVSCLNSLESG